MKLRATFVCKNEDDIILDSVLHASKYCDEIYVYDLGSTDNTVDIIKDIENEKIFLFDSVNLPFHDGRSADVWKSLWNSKSREEFTANDWYAIIDADEFISIDPRPILTCSSYKRYGVNKQCLSQVHFFLTDECLNNNYSNQEIQNRMKYTAMDLKLGKIEPRFFRCEPNPVWYPEPNRINQRGYKIPQECNVNGWKLILNKHYPFRSIDQLEKRFHVRKKSIAEGGIYVSHWNNKINKDVWIKKKSDCKKWNKKKYFQNLSKKHLLHLIFWSFRIYISTALNFIIPSNYFEKFKSRILKINKVNILKRIF